MIERAVYVPYKDIFEIWFEYPTVCIKTDGFFSRQVYENLRKAGLTVVYQDLKHTEGFIQNES